MASAIQFIKQTKSANILVLLVTRPHVACLEWQDVEELSVGIMKQDILSSYISDT